MHIYVFDAKVFVAMKENRSDKNIQEEYGNDKEKLLLAGYSDQGVQM